MPVGHLEVERAKRRDGEAGEELVMVIVVLMEDIHTTSCRRSKHL